MLIVPDADISFIPLLAHPENGQFSRAFYKVSASGSPLKHKELLGQESKIRLSLQDPDFVLYSQSDDNYQYHRLFAKTPVSEKHLLVVVKHLDGEGFVITAFFLTKIREKRKVKVYER